MLKAEYLITDNAGEKILVNYDGERFAIVQTTSNQNKTIILNPIEASQIACFITSQLKLNRGEKDG